MSKITLICFALLSVLFFGNSSENYAAQPKEHASDASTGTLQKMIVENGSVTLNVDLNGLNGSNALITRPAALQFAAASNSFFSILVFNDQLRGAESGSIALVPQGRPVSMLPSLLATSLKQLVVEKLPCRFGFRHGCARRENRLHVFQNRRTSIRLRCQGAVTRCPKWTAADVKRICRRRSAVPRMLIPSLEKSPLAHGCNRLKSRNWLMANPIDDHASAASLQPRDDPGPDVIVGDLPSMEQFGSDGTQVGLAVGTTSCNKGTVDLDWFALPQTIIRSFRKISIG